MRAGRQHKFRAGGLPFSSNGDLLNENNGLSTVKGQVRQVEHCQALYGTNPELAVGRYSHVGSADAALRRGHAIGSAKPRVIGRVLRVGLVLSEGVCGKPEDAVPSGEPQLSSLGSRHAEQIEVVIYLYQLVSFNAVNPLWRRECIKIARRVFSETHITGIEDLMR